MGDNPQWREWQRADQASRAAREMQENLREAPRLARKNRMHFLVSLATLTVLILFIWQAQEAPTRYLLLVFAAGALYSCIKGVVAEVRLYILTKKMQEHLRKRGKS